MPKTAVRMTAAAALVATITPLAGMTARAQDLNGFGGVSAGVGTLGATVEGSWRVSPQLGFRGVIGYGSFSYSDTASGENYTGDVDSFGVGLLADYYPFGSGLRLTGGAIIPNYQASLIGRDITIGPLTSDIEVDIQDQSAISPALALGFSGRLANGITVSGDLGALYVGGFGINARDPNGTFSQSDIDAEIQDISDTLRDANIVPYASISIGMSF